MGCPSSRSGKTYFPDQIAYTGCGGVIAPVVNADYEQEVVSLVNDERANNGLPPLKRVASLDKPARYHAADMGQDDYFKHDSYDRVNGNLQYACGTFDRVLSYYDPNWRSLAENIAAGYRAPQNVMSGWMNSPGHRANILSASVWEIGVGYYTGSGSYSSYWTQDFGRRGDVYPLIINREAARTESQTVQLYVYGSGEWGEMRLKNNAGGWSAWQPFQSELSWQLDPLQGTQTVSVELRQGSQTTLSSDDIYADLPIPELGGLPASVGFLYSQATDELTPPHFTP